MRDLENKRLYNYHYYRRNLARRKEYFRQYHIKNQARRNTMARLRLQKYRDDPAWQERIRKQNAESKRRWKDRHPEKAKAIDAERNFIKKIAFHWNVSRAVARQMINDNRFDL